MTNIQLYAEISTLPSTLKQEVSDFVEFLKSKKESKSTLKERNFGCAKGKIIMKPDFNEPLDDFKEYM